MAQKQQPVDKIILTGEQKEQILRWILVEKDVLLGKYDSKVTAQRKQESWQKIMDNSVELGFLQKGISWKWMRDSFYSNARKRTVVSF